MSPCDICGKISHVWFNCPLRDTKPKDWKPERLSKRSTAARKDVRFSPSLESTAGAVRGIDDDSNMPSEPAGNQALSVDTIPKPHLGRPRIHPDRKAYRAAWMKDWRARKKASAEGRDDR